MNPAGKNQSQYFCDIENRSLKTCAEGVDIKTFWGDKMLVSIVSLDANAIVPMHSHPQEQIGTVLFGVMEMNIGDEKRRLNPGDTYIIPGGVEHNAVVGNEPAKSIDVFSPVREDYQY